MPAKYARHVAMRGPTPQNQPAPGREKDQVKNQAGGFVFQTGDWTQLDRFLILGAEGNTYYASERKMTVDNAQAAMRCIAQDGLRVVNRVAEISDAGRAIKNDPALFVLALCAASDDEKTRRAAMLALPKVARIGTHLFHFADFVNAQRGWGRALRRGVGDWYNLQPVERLIDQAAKYQQRDGWSNRDLLRLSHPKTQDPARKAVYDWICGRQTENLPAKLRAFDDLKANPTGAKAVELIHAHNLPRECIPTDLLNDPDVWAALLESMPLQAMVRNLAKMTAVGLLKPFSPELQRVQAALADENAIRKARLHPVSILMALRTYAQGHGDRGKLSWGPIPQVVDALDKAFYHAFKVVEPTNKRIMLGLDISGSMFGGTISGTSMTPAEGVGAMALVTAATEPNYAIMGFTSTFEQVNITPRMRLDDVQKHMRQLSHRMGSTDCSLPVLYALKHGLAVDAFCIYTDNETWAGTIHPFEALKEYRRKTGINAKMVVVGMTATNFTIADPKDPGMLDVVGFDSNAPALIADFIRN